MILQNSEQSIENIIENIVMIVDEDQKIHGSGFLTYINNTTYCLTLHHCIFDLDKIFIKKSLFYFLSL